MDFDSIEDVRKQYAKAVLLEKLNCETDKEQIDAILKTDGFTNIERYAELKNNEAAIDKIYRQEFDDFAKFEDIFSKAVALSDFAEADRNNIKTVLNAHSEILSADLSKLSDYRLGIAATEILKGSYSDFNALDSAVTGLCERERKILYMRYYEGKTQTEISEEIGLSQAQVSRLEKNALKSIKSKVSY